MVRIIALIFTYNTIKGRLAQDGSIFKVFYFFAILFIYGVRLDPKTKYSKFLKEL